MLEWLKFYRFYRPIKELEKIINSESTDSVRNLYRTQCMAALDEDEKSDQDLLDYLDYNAGKTIFLRKDSERIIAGGDSQLVLRLNKGWAAKAANHFEFHDFYAIKTCPSYCPHSTYAAEFLNQEFGFEIPMTTAEFYYENGHVKFKIDARGYGTFMIVRDLTEGGKYLVKDIAEDEDFSKFNNGDVLKEFFGEYISRLIDLYYKYERVSGTDLRNSRLRVGIDHHVQEGPEGAMRRMFFLQIDPETNTAEIVPGDFDHVYFYWTR